MTRRISPAKAPWIVAVTAIAGLLWPTAGPAESTAAPTADRTTFASASRAARAVVESGSLDPEELQGFEFEGIAGMERLGDSNRWLVEVTIHSDVGAIRLPMKLADTNGGWTVSWMPNRQYERALKRLLSDGNLPSVASAGDSETAGQPSHLSRLPSLPIILDGDRAITPVGTADLSDSPRPPRQLKRLVESWVNDVAEGARGIASIDVVASSSTNWNQLTAVAYAAASSGLFRMYMLVQNASGRLHMLSTATPVSGSGRGLDPSTSLILGMDSARYSDKTGRTHRSFRLSVQGELITPRKRAEPCTASAALCLAAPSALGSDLRELLGQAFATPPSISHVMFAATGNVEIGEALPYLARVHSSLGIESGQLFVGYIGETSDFTDARRPPGGRR